MHMQHPCLAFYSYHMMASSRRLLIVPQLLLAPPFAALNSSILATRRLNSSYWHFSYVCRSLCGLVVSRPRTLPGLDSQTNLALPRQVVLFETTAVQRDQKMGTGVSVGQWQSRRAHLLARGLCIRQSVSVGVQSLGTNWRPERGTLTLRPLVGDGNSLLYLLGDGHGGGGDYE